jgi:hypothetical protein
MDRIFKNYKPGTRTNLIYIQQVLGDYLLVPAGPGLS